MADADHLAAARHAWREGKAALHAGRIGQARTWLDYAYRLAPRQDDLAIACAAARLRAGEADGAASLLRNVLRRHDLREAWFLLAAARSRTGDAVGAAEALARALQRHATPDSARALCDTVSRTVGAAGWCGLQIDADGRARLAHGPGGPDPILSLDNASWPACAPLPEAWQTIGCIEARSGDRMLLGSPLSPARIGRTEGFVEARAGGLRGWAWLPGDPDCDPVLRIVPATGDSLSLAARDMTVSPDEMPPLARPRGFALAAGQLAGLAGPFRLLGPDGSELYGSPLDPAAEARAAGDAARTIGRWLGARPDRLPDPAKIDPALTDAPPMVSVPADLIGAAPAVASARARRRRGVDVVVPVYRGFAETMACLRSVLDDPSPEPDARLVVVEDRSPEPELVAALEALAGAGRIVLIRQARNGGFPRAANAGLRHGASAGGNDGRGGRDAILLNSDTLVPPGWIGRLRRAAHAAPDIGTVTPLSNDATILSYPDPDPAPGRENPTPGLDATVALDRAAAEANGEATIEIPTGIGFCLYIRRDCLDAVGTLREDVFAQGYGEENDWCQRARYLGWRHVAHPGVFVAHLGGRSFGGAKAHLIGRNLRILNRLHPGYDALVAAFVAADPLAPARRRLDLSRWRARSVAAGPAPAALLVTHARGGGVARHVRERGAALRAGGWRPLLLLPAGPGACRLDEDDGDGGRHNGGGGSGAFPNLVFAMPAERGMLLNLLREAGVARTELHHFIGHHPCVAELHLALGVPQTVVAHDYALFCPRVALTTTTRRYCGEPDLAACEACVADCGNEIEDEIGVAALRRRSAAWLGAAADVVAPSRDAVARLARRFPGLRPRPVAWEPDPGLPTSGPPMRCAVDPALVCVVGAIGVEKGYDVLLACARDAAGRALPLRFVVIGYTIDDARLLATGRVRITGPYEPGEVASLICAQGAGRGFLPSVWPETWSYALGEMWCAGLEVLAFDLGAPAERIARAGRGRLAPLGLPAGRINDLLLDWR